MTATFDEVLGRRPELAAKHHHLLDLVTDGRVDPDLLGLCRGRVGLLLGCSAHAAPAPAWDGLSAGRQACLDFAERFVLDPAAVDDDLAARVRGHLGASGFVAFTCALAVFEGQCRFERMFATEGA